MPSVLRLAVSRQTLGFLLMCFYVHSEKNQTHEVDDYMDLPEEGSYEEETEAELFYEDALKHALNLLWQQRYQISMANLQLIQILGQNATETIKFRKELHTIRDLVDLKILDLRNKLQNKPFTKNLTEPIEKPVFERLTRTWIDVGGVFDTHQPKERTYEFSQMYNWIKNIKNETTVGYRKVNWLMSREVLHQLMRKVEP